MTVNELTQARNKLDAQIWAAKYQLVQTNLERLVEEILNFLDEVGEDYISGDYYAPRRYYSSIKGIKNIRVGRNSQTILVKLTSPAGRLLPEEVEIRGIVYAIEYTKSDHYCSGLNY
jgi:hypothetical protein